jgi:hypothetical protein
MLYSMVKEFKKEKISKIINVIILKLYYKKMIRKREPI